MTARRQFNPNTALGQLLAEAVDQIQEGKAKLNRVSEILYAAIYVPSGSPDMAAVEAELGAPAGQGQGLFDIVNGCKTALDDARVSNLREIDQG